MDEYPVKDVDMRLSSRNNSDEWAKAFKIVATKKEVWKVYTNEEPQVAKPDVHTFIPESPTGYTRVQTSRLLKLYKVALDKHDKYRKKVLSAGTLLLIYVDDSIRDEIEEKVGEPHTAWKWLRTRFQADKRASIGIIVKSWDDLRFDNKNGGMQRYLSLHRRYYQQLKDAEVTIPEIFVLIKIIDNLPRRFNTWLNRYYEARKAATCTDTLDNLETQLLIEHDNLTMRYEAERKEPNNSRKETTKTGRGESKSEPKIYNKEFCAKCKKTGHTLKNC